MSKFKFRLATLLKLREAARNECRARLAEAYEAERQLRERRLELEQESLETKRRYCVPLPGGSVDIDTLLTAHRYETVLRAELKTIAQQETALAAEIEKRRQAVVAADREVKVLEKLRETQLERFQHDQAKREIKQLDEVGARAAAVRGTEP